jgi:phosphoglycolate phosphatase
MNGGGHIPPIDNRHSAIDNPPMTHRAVLFDLDGTLADTLVDIAGAANHALERLDRPRIEVPRFRYLAGQGLEYLMNHALAPEDRPLVPKAMELFHEYYAVHSEDHTAPYDGVPAMLDELTRRGMTIAVLSNKPHAAAQAMVARVFARWAFAAVIGHREGSPLKPDPSGAIEIAAAVRIPPGEWLYAGDTRVDMLTATRAGMFPVGVLWGFREEAELRQNGARAIIARPDELLPLLG